MNREVQVRICERLGVKFPGPTRQSRRSDLTPVTSGLPMKADIFGAGRDLSKAPLPDFRAAQVGDSTPSKSWGPEPGSPFATKPLSLSS